jgi:type IV fimbrial biogenesis protein FimT
MLSMRSARGFTMIELMVGIAVVAVLFALGLPSMGALLQNNKLGSAAKSYMQGIQIARTEAIRRNATTEFVLTATPIGPGIETAAAPAATGPHWVARAASGASWDLIEAKSSADGSGQVSANSVQVNATGGASIAFNGFGVPIGGTAFSIAVSNPAGGACATAGGTMRCQQIRIRPGGQVFLCDPAVAASDNRACPP